MLSLYLVIIFGNGGLPFLAQLHPCEGGDGVLEHYRNPIVGEFLQIWPTAEARCGCRQERGHEEVKKQRSEEERNM